jgi:tetratricopeptide (TPR) repeat protein
LLDANRGKDAVQYVRGLEQTADVRPLLLDVYLHEKDYASLERICKSALLTNPLNNRARLALAEVALARNDRARAEVLLEQVRRQPPVAKDIRIRMANLELWAGNGATALAEYRALLAKEPTQPELWKGFVGAAGSAKELTADDAKIIRSIAEPSATTSTDPVFLSRLAWVLHRLKETALCNRALDRAQALRPTEAEARKELAGVLAAAGRYKEALTLYQSLPLDAQDHQTLAGLGEAIGDFAAAAAQYRMILEKDPDDLRMLERMAQVLSWKKDYPEAIKAYERLTRADPKNQTWLLRLAELKLWSGDAAGALAAYSQLLEANPRQPDLWPGFVDAAGMTPRLSSEQAQLARRVGREIQSQPAKDPQFLSRLAWVLVKSGATADAEAVLNRADALAPQDPKVRKEMAGVFGSVGKFRRAIELFQGLEKLSFEDRVRLVEFYNGARDFAASEDECRKLLKMQPNDPKVELMLADILSWRGNYLEAAELLQQLRRTSARSPELDLRLARVELWSHNYTAALQRFANLLEANPNQPALWPDFVAAAAAAPSIDDRYRHTLVALADTTIADTTVADAQFLSRLAQAMRTLEEPARAMPLLERAIKADPTSRPLVLLLAQTLYDAGRYDEAKRYFRELLP